MTSPIPLRQRIFDHFTGGEPEDARFSRIARVMIASPFWTSAPEYKAPAAISGEITRSREIRRMAMLDEAIREAAAAEGVSVAEYAGRLLRAAQRKATKP